MTEALPLPVVLLLVIVVGGAVGFVNGFSVAKFKLHPFIVTLSTQLIVYGIILMYLMNGTNNGQTLSGMTAGYRSFVTGTLFKIGNVAVPMYVLYAVILTAIMWVIWNKTTFGKNMFAVGSNEEAANVSGVNVSRTIMMVFTLAGMMYGYYRFPGLVRVSLGPAPEQVINYRVRRHRSLRYRRRILRRRYRTYQRYRGGRSASADHLRGTELPLRRREHAVYHQGSDHIDCLRHRYEKVSGS